jgi:amino acid transporter
MSKKLGYFSATAIGIGAMIGGCFAAVGISVELAGKAAPLTFGIAGLIALVTAYSYSKLAVRFPKNGGTVEFFNMAFGKFIFGGALNILTISSYVFLLCIYSYAFGSYSVYLFHAPPVWKHAAISGIIIFFTILNFFGAGAVGRSQVAIVAIQLLIVAVFLGFGLYFILGRQPVSAGISGCPLAMLAGGLIVFHAYEGFELVANTADEVKNPAATLPKAFYTAVIVSGLIYILSAMVTANTITSQSAGIQKDYALAASAGVFSGIPGSAAIVIAVILATSSAINSTFYGVARMCNNVANSGQIPQIFENTNFKIPVGWLIVTSILSLVLANLLDISSMALAGSCGFLAIFAAVNWANARLHKETKSRASISAFAAILCIAALGALIIYTISTAPMQFLFLIFLTAACFVTELLYFRYIGKIACIFCKRTYTQ